MPLFSGEPVTLAEIGILGFWAFADTGGCN